MNLEYVGVDLKITRNHDNYVILEQLSETTYKYAHRATKIATAWAMTARDYYG